MRSVDRRPHRLSGLALLLGLLAVGTTSPGHALPVEEAPDLTVAVMAVGRDVDRTTRRIVAPADTFPADVGRLYCLTRISGAADTTSVTHVWVHAGTPLARVRLPVRSPDWRTWSSKRILPSWTGEWEVMVLDADGGVLARRTFHVLPENGERADERAPAGGRP